MTGFFLLATTSIFNRKYPLIMLIILGYIHIQLLLIPKVLNSESNSQQCHTSDDIFSVVADTKGTKF